MEQKVLNNLSYGLFVLTACRDGVDNGCITNTLQQVTTNPVTLSVAVNKASLTCEMIRDTKKFTASILSEDAKFETFQRFGFRSGKNGNKFADYTDCRRTSNGTLAITAGTNAYISVDVVSQVDLGSHILFLGTPTEATVLSDVPSATYAYYFANIKPKPARTEMPAKPETAAKPTEGCGKYAGTRTEKNLREAFAGESQARNKYTYFASVAKKAGFEQIAAIFLQTAENEKEHAKLWFKELGGLGDTPANLTCAADGEYTEWSDMYERMAREAEEEGFHALAAKFRGIIEIEKKHEERFRKLLRNIEMKQVFEKTGITIWECRNCGHIAVGMAAPECCPVCGHPQAYFEMRSENY